MSVTVTFPDGIAARLGLGEEEFGRRALEVLLAEEYRAGQLTKADLQRALGFTSPLQLDSYFKKYTQDTSLSIEDVELDAAKLRRLGLRAGPRVVAETGPLAYLAQIGAIESLSRMFEHVWLPQEAVDELVDPGSPETVRRWARHLPPWLWVAGGQEASGLGSGFRRAQQRTIGLARAIGADAVLIDDRAGALVAEGLGFQAIGTLGVLVHLANEGLVDLATALAALERTAFGVPPMLLPRLLARYRG